MIITDIQKIIPNRFVFLVFLTFVFIANQMFEHIPHILLLQL